MRKLVITALLLALAVFSGVGILHAELGTIKSGIDRLLGRFAVVDVVERSLDGAPALAITLTEPVDPRASPDKHLSVVEMELRPQDQTKRPETEDEEEYGWDSGNSDPNKSSLVSTEAADLETKGGRKVKGSWVVGENPRILYFPHIKPQSRYVVRIAPELADKAGNTLGAETKVSIRTAAVSPAFFFASRGMVLPAHQNGGIPVVTVNVPEVDVQFLRIKNEDLPKFLDQVIRGKPTPRKDGAQARGEDGGEGEGGSEDEYDWRDRYRSAMQGATSGWDLDRIHKMARSVYAGRFNTERRANRRAVTYLPVEGIRELQEPGVYLAVMSQPGRFRHDYQVTYFYVSDLGLHVKQFEKGADAWVSSLTDGQAVANVDIAWLDAQGKTLAQAKTNSEGRASFAERPAKARVVMARRDKQVSLIALKEPSLDLSEYEISGNANGPVRLFAWSGRDLYRPGESLTVSVMARDSDGRPLPPLPIQAILKRPDGQKVLTASWSPDKAHAGYYQQRLDLPADAATGFWNLELRSDPAAKSPAAVMRFGVEEFLPERMKLDLAASAAALSPSDALTVKVSGSYLYGAPATGNSLLGVVQFERNRNPLAAQLPGFEFGDSGEDAIRVREELPETTLDDKGTAAIAVDLSKLSKRRSPFTVRTTWSLLESGGRPVVRSLERTVWPADTMMGVRPLFVGSYAKEGSLAEFEVVRVGRDGKLLAGAGLPVRLFREDRHYYWRFEDSRGWHSGFTETDELVETTLTATPAGGRGRLGVPVKYGRYRLEILDPDSGATLRYRFYAGWSAKGDETQGIRPDKVALKFDKPSYKDGETARLTILPPHAGEAIVSVEGDRALWTRRLSLPAAGTTVEIPVATEWRRHDLYVSVIALRPGNEGDKVTPTRALGLIHLPLDRGDRRLAVKLEAPVKGAPGDAAKVRIKVPAAQGQKALVTLSAVDVGILNITRFATPDPHGYYFGRLRYGADLNDVYGRLIEKMAGRKGRLKWGGDNTPKPTRSLPQKVRLVDIFSGAVALDAKGEAEIPLPLPDFNGTLRLMAVAATPERFGSAEAEMIIAAPLVAELLTPRFLTFGDNATLALDLTNLSGGDTKFDVSVTGDSALTVAEGTRSVALKDKQKITLRYKVSAGQEHGLRELTVRIVGGGRKLERKFPLMVQAPTPLQRVARRFTVEPGKTLDVRDAEFGGLMRGSLAAHLVLSDKPPIDVRSAIRGLLTYPYGCAEQTTSTAYPHVFVDEESARHFGLKPYSREERAKMLDHAFGRLATMQAPQGGFALWGGGGPEYWLSAYVTHFLIDAKQAGFAPPEAMLNKARDYLLRGLQEGVARLPAGSQPAARTGPASGQDIIDFDALAYGGYVLSRENKAPLATLRQLHDLRAQAQTGLPLVQLGLALRAMGDDKRGGDAIEDGLGRIGSKRWWHYGSPLRDSALAWVLLARQKVETPARDRLLDAVAAELATARWFSTQEQLALFLAGRELGLNRQGEWKAELSLGGKAEAVTHKGALFRELTAAQVGAGTRVRNMHAGKLYAELVMSGFAAKAPPAKSEPLAVTRTLYAPDGSRIGSRPLRVGESVIVHVAAASSVAIGNGLIVDRIPAGLEIENRNLVQGESFGGTRFDNIDPAQAMADRRIQHVEYRDDRFVAAVRLDGYRNKVNLFYRARAVTPGRFVVPPLHAEDMYRPEVFGLSGGGETTTVVEAERGGQPAAAGKKAGAAKKTP